MAKFIKIYEIHIGDYVRFRTINGQILCGTVQCISEFPDLWVEVGDPHLDNYNRYHISINLIEDVLTSALGHSWAQWKWDDVEFDKNEIVEFIYNEDLTDKIYTKLNDL